VDFETVALDDDNWVLCLRPAAQIKDLVVQVQVPQNWQPAGANVLARLHVHGAAFHMQHVNAQLVHIQLPTLKHGDEVSLHWMRHT
jgi:hypothetical protein